MRRLKPAVTIVLSLFILSLSSGPAKAQPLGAQDQPMKCPMMRPVHAGMGSPGTEEGASFGDQKSPMGLDLMETLHRWAGLFFSMREELALEAQQIDRIRVIFLAHLKYAIPKQAERRVMILEIEQSLAQDEIDVNAVEQKVKTLETLNTRMTMEGVRTLQEAFSALNPEQRSLIKTRVRESLYSRLLGMGGISAQQGGSHNDRH